MLTCLSQLSLTLSKSYSPSLLFSFICILQAFLSTHISSLHTHTHTHTLSGFHKQNIISQLFEKLHVFPCLSKYHAIKTYGGLGIQLHTLPTSILDALFHSHFQMRHVVLHLNYCHLQKVGIHSIHPLMVQQMK